MQAENLPAYLALEKALQHVLHIQIQRLAIPRVLSVAIREICILQQHFTQRQGSRPYHLLEHPRFRAGYDLLLLRAATGEPITEIAEWWAAFYMGDTTQREKLLKTGNKPTSRKRRRRRIYKKKSEERE
jgi:poly(A) polymerase